MNEFELAESIADKVQPDIESAFLLGYVVLAEWMDADGTRWLTRNAGNGQGEFIPAWQLNGYLNEALNNWPSVDDEAE